MRAPSPLELHRHLHRLFGFPGFRPGQQEVIEQTLQGENVLAVMPTGAGKSLCYQLPAALSPHVTLVISPLIALMQDQVEGLPPALKRSATVINSTLDGSEVERRLRALREGQIRLLYAAPERLRQVHFLYALARAKIGLVVVDEAHCVDQWGHDFRPDYARLAETVNALGNPPVLALTATATLDTAKTIECALGVPLKRMVFGICRPNLRLEVVACLDEETRRETIVRRCHAERGRGLLYTNRRHEAEEMAGLLRRFGVEAAHYHAALEPEERAQVHAQYRNGALRVLVATVAFGLGVDIPDVRFVFHQAPPESLEGYAQEAGRAGRDGLLSRCVLFTTPDDMAHLTRRQEEGRLRIEQFKTVYETVCQSLPEKRSGLVGMDDLRRDSGLEGTEIRVALSWLDEVDLLRRHYDTPVVFSLKRGLDAETAPTEVHRLMQSSCPADGSWNDIDAPTLSELAGLPIERLESFLLACQEEGWLIYRGGWRELTLERLKPPPGAKAALERSLERYRQAQATRLTSLQGYMEMAQCRHHYLATYFGDEAPATCAACDNCRPEEVVVSSQGSGVSDQKEARSDAEMQSILLRCVASLPFAMGKTSLVKLLRGAFDSPLSANRSAYFGVLADVSREVLGEQIDALLECGHLKVELREAYRLLTLTPTGIQAAREGRLPTPLPPGTGEGA